MTGEMSRVEGEKFAKTVTRYRVSVLWMRRRVRRMSWEAHSRSNLLTTARNATVSMPDCDASGMLGKLFDGELFDQPVLGDIEVHGVDFIQHVARTRAGENRATEDERNVRSIKPTIVDDDRKIFK